MSLYEKTKTKDFLEVKRSASGLGLFTNQDIPQGSFILEYTGELISLDKAYEKGGKYLFKINSKCAIDGKDRENIGRYLNHFCKPNCYVQISKNMILIFALRDISKGEELGFDYGKEYFLAFIKPNGCKCPYCRLKQMINH